MGHVYPERFKAMNKTLERNLIGSPADIADRLQLYGNAGSTYVGLKFIYRSVDELLRGMRLFRLEVATRFD